MTGPRTFEVEEEFDPESLGLLVNPKPKANGTPAIPGRPKLSQRALSGQYQSADWAPSDTESVPSVPSPKAATTPAISAKDLLDALLASAVALPPKKTQSSSRIEPHKVPEAHETSDHAVESTTTPSAPITIASRQISPSAETDQLGVSLDSGIQTDIVSDSEMSNGPSRHVVAQARKAKLDVRLVAIRRKDGKGYRTGIRVRRPSAAAAVLETDTEVKEEGSVVATVEIEQPPDPVKYDSLFQENLAVRFGTEALDKLNGNAKADANTAHKLPHQARELVSSLTDLRVAVSMANDLRTEIGAPLLSTRTNKAALRKSVAVTQQKLYTDIASALILPSAPDPSPKLWEAERSDDKPKLQFTPSSLEIMARKLPEAFPYDRAALRAFWASGKRAAYGEEGNKVLWERGIGRMSGKYGTGFREKAIETDSAVHIFVDHSNILYGLLNHLQHLPASSLPPKHLRIMSLPCISLLLRRGRDTPPGSMHAVASSPLKQDLDPLVRLGWEVSVMKRVEIYEDEVLDPAAMNLVAKPQQHVHGTGENHVGLKRFREQGVDEILHLKLLQALNTKPSPAPKGSTIVLATGDARGGQFNRDGFLGAVREALKRGWAVELWSWRAGLSRGWVETAKREKWNASFGINILDDWAEHLIEVAPEEVD